MLDLSPLLLLQFLSFLPALRSPTSYSIRKRNLKLQTPKRQLPPAATPPPLSHKEIYFSEQHWKEAKCQTYNWASCQVSESPHPTLVTENYLQPSKQLCCSERKGGFFRVFTVLATLTAGENKKKKKRSKPHSRIATPQEHEMSPRNLRLLTDFTPTQHRGQQHALGSPA